LTDRPAQGSKECSRLHTRLLKCTLEVENSRAYWRHVAERGASPAAQVAFEEFWFGARSLGRTKVLMTNFRARFDAFPPALQALAIWTNMDPDTRRLICHWHLQLADPLYRAFTDEYLVERHQRLPAEVSHTPVVTWVGQHGGGRWNMATKIQFASKLLSSAFAVGLITATRDPRPVHYPRVDDGALTYLIYLLRHVDISGSLLANPYLASVGLGGSGLEERLKGLPAMRFRRQGDLIDFGWRYRDLLAWADAAFGEQDSRACAGGVM